MPMMLKRLTLTGPAAASPAFKAAVAAGLEQHTGRK